MPNSPAAPDHLGVKLAQAIKEKGVQQTDVAAAFGVKRPTVSGDWIKHGRIGKRRIPQLVRYFERPYEWWFDDVATTTKRGDSMRGYAPGSASRFREAMTRKGYQKPDLSMNVEALATSAQCSPSTIAKFLSEEGPPMFIDALTLLRICDELAVTPYWLLCNQGAMTDIPEDEIPMQALRKKPPSRKRRTEEMK